MEAGKLDVTILLADHAQVADGKLNLIGAGWSLTSGGDQAVPFGIALLIRVPWSRTNEPISLTVELVDEDNNPVLDGSGKPITLTIDFEVGRPPGLPHGTEIDQPVAFNSSPLPLPHGKRFSWRVREGDQPLAEARFGTRPA